jgi:hypothetical protein
MTGSGFAYGQSVNNVSNTQVIYACVTGINGNIVKVSNTQKTCPRGTTPISWNMVGPQGIQGIPGTAVAKGDKGDKGDQGLQGLKGDQGLDGKEGAPGLSTSSGTYRVFESTGLRKPVVLGSMIEVAGQAFNIDGSGKLLPAITTPVVFAQPDCQGDSFGVLESTYGAGLAVASEDTSGQSYWGTHVTDQDWQEFKSIYIPKPSWRLENQLERLFLYWERDWDKNVEDYAPDPLYNVGSGRRCVNLDMARVQQLFLSHYSPSQQMAIRSQISSAIKKLTPLPPLPEFGPWHYEFPQN